MNYAVHKYVNGGVHNRAELEARGRREFQLGLGRPSDTRD
jgi:hypothetical protein